MSTKPSKNLRKANYLANVAGDSIDLTLQFTNHLKRDVSAFTGLFIFKDIFGRDIMTLELANGGDLNSGGSIEWKGNLPFNQFDANENRLANIAKSDLIVEFLLKAVIYKDNTREFFNE